MSGAEPRAPVASGVHAVSAHEVTGPIKHANRPRPRAAVGAGPHVRVGAGEPAAGPRLLRPGDPRYRSLSLLVALGPPVRRRSTAARLHPDSRSPAVRRLWRGAADRAHRPARGARDDLRSERQGSGVVDARQERGRRPRAWSAIGRWRPAAWRGSWTSLRRRWRASSPPTPTSPTWPGRSTIKVAKRVEDLDIPGVLIIDESARLLPAGDMARSLLGSVDVDNVGVAGLERRYDDQLAGDPGEYMVERDLGGPDHSRWAEPDRSRRAGRRHRADDRPRPAVRHRGHPRRPGAGRRRPGGLGRRDGSPDRRGPGAGQRRDRPHRRTPVANTGNNLAVTQNFEPGIGEQGDHDVGGPRGRAGRARTPSSRCPTPCRSPTTPTPTRTRSHRG